KLDSKILCIPAKILFQKGKWDGLKRDDLDHYYQLLLSHSEFRIREELEHDPQFKQIIPQVVFKHQDSYFLHRQVAANETRLNSLCPLPIGGHVEEFDQKIVGQDIIQAALDREVDEEVFLETEVTKRTFLGIIYLEDENPVNHVHVGIAYIFEVKNPNIRIKEEGLEDVGWVSANYLNENIDSLTYWSKVILKEHINNSFTVAPNQ
ncbi:NUDIX domain-containing protein, partial [candidate division WWE3 bacterium]|nr:NUDIX domain-containing protein [candidate division WWE3 bacterium]